MSSSSLPKNAFKFLLIAGGLALVAVGCLQRSQDPAPVTITASETPPELPARVSNADFGTFSHDVPEHKQFSCNSCHTRSTGSLDIKFNGHQSCIGCHINQFTNPKATMCTICHVATPQTPPPVKAFPVRFNEDFNMKFDHAAHTRGDGLPREGCASCHAPRGPGKTIPVGINAHVSCFTCHTPESKIGSCNVCHVLAPYSRTPPSRYVFKAVFSHADHTSAQGLNCNDCHTVRAGAPQSRQVTSILAQEHRVAPANNCASCHNGTRAFDGNNPLQFVNCQRCHKGSGFDMLPGSP